MKQKCDILPFLVHPALIPTKVAFSEIAGFFLCNSLLYSPKGKYYQHISRWKGLQQSKLAEASGSFEIHRSWLVWLMADWKALQGTKSESQVKRWLNRPSSDWPWHNTSRAENNGRSTDNVRPDCGLDQSNSHLAGHFDRSFLDTNIFFCCFFAQKTSKKKNAAIH